MVRGASAKGTEGLWCSFQGKGGLAVQRFDILREYASGLHAFESLSRFAFARFSEEPS